MSNINISDEELLAIEISFAELTNKFTKEGFSPYACAAVMTKIAFMIYKTSMNAEDYNSMIDTISENRDRIQSFHTTETLN